MKSVVENWWQFLPVLVVLSLVSPALVAFRYQSQLTPPFNVNVSYHAINAQTGKSLENDSFILNVSTDSSGTVKVCTSNDDGQWHTIDRGNGFTESAKSTCAGCFDQKGNLSYTKTITDDVYNYKMAGFTCNATPYSITFAGIYNETSNSFAGNIDEFKTTLSCSNSSNIDQDVTGS